MADFRRCFQLPWWGGVFAPLLCVAAGGSDSTPAASASVLEPVRLFALQGQFAGKKPGELASDLSGIACVGGSGVAPRRCVAINDENQSAQFVTVNDGTLVVGAEVALVGAEPSSRTVGLQPTVDCPNGDAAFAEFDGEGVAYAAPYFYVVGSHGCSRSKGKFRLSSFLLARIRVDAEGRAIDQAPVETTYRLADALRRAPGVGAHFAKDLNAGNGLNIEGIAVIDGVLIAGLRAPSTGGQAFLVRARVDDLFAPGAAPLAAAPEVVALALGPNRGIRDLAALPDGRLLVLAGPAQEQGDVPYSLAVVEPHPSDVVTALATLAPARLGGKLGKAEGITVLAADDAELRVLILFDGLDNGGAREYRVPLPQRRS